GRRRLGRIPDSCTKAFTRTIVALIHLHHWPDHSLREEDAMSDAALDYNTLDAERERIRHEHMREAPGPSTARGVHHVALLCSDVEQTVRFYQDLLEFPLTDMFEN